jgi:hypothetical protein
MSAFQVSRLEEIPAVEVSGDAEWKPLRYHFGVRAFGVNAWIGHAEGDEVIEEHDEREDDCGGHEELYLVTTGHAEFRIDGETIDAPTGTFVFVGDPDLRRAAYATEPETTIVSIGAEPGRAFTVSDWEARGVKA